MDGRVFVRKREKREKRQRSVESRGEVLSAGHFLGDSRHVKSTTRNLKVAVLGHLRGMNAARLRKASERL